VQQDIPLWVIEELLTWMHIKTFMKCAERYYLFEQQDNHLNGQQDVPLDVHIVP
jgi:hypothetical protein